VLISKNRCLISAVVVYTITAVFNFKNWFNEVALKG